MGQTLDLDAFAHPLPGLRKKGFLQFRQPPLWRTHQVRGAHRAHLFQALFRGYTPIHDPDPLRTTVACLDALEEITQRVRVLGVACEHFVAQRKAFRSNDQSNHPLPAVKPLIPTLVAAFVVMLVAVLSLVVLLARRVRFEIRAGQIVEQHIEPRLKQLAPAPLQKLE